ncbi:MAG: response regulator transcription factor [Gammaproteobacteria bacterium]|nr:response regulator transcription factor [Gammaproteobacteria bacterium]
MSKNILLVEDNADIAHLVVLHLKDRNMQVTHIADGKRGLEEALSDRYDLLVLDLMLPGMDGMELCRNLRSAGVFTPVLMLTARTSELDRVLGLEVGADDYLGKPFSVPELIARVNALLRRADVYASKETVGDKGILAFEGLSINPERREVMLDKKRIELTAREFDLLLHFANHPGRVFSRSQLLDLVWGYGHDGYEHTVNSHINRLRTKIEIDPAKPRFVLTVWGVGYKFADAGLPGAAS